MLYIVLKIASRFPMLSFEKLVLIRVTTILCNNQQLLSLISKSFFTITAKATFCVIEKEWKAVQDMANQLVSKITLPVIMKKRILNLLWPVSYKIMLWKSIYARSIESKFLHFYWTRRGGIDNTRTIQFIIRNEDIRIKKRFILACSVCLREEICKLWVEMSNRDKTYVTLHTRHQISRPILEFWTHVMRGSDNVLERYKTSALTCAVQCGFKEAVKYFFSISTADERRNMAASCEETFADHFEDAVLVEDEVEIESFLFLQMTAEDIKIFVYNHYRFFWSTSIYYPQDLFLGFLSMRDESDSTDDIIILLRLIFHNYHLEVEDDDYSMLFVEVWRKLSISEREIISDTELGVEILAVLVRDHFSFLLEKLAFKKMSEYIKTNTSPARFGFHPGKNEFLNFLILEEVVTIASLKKYKNEFLDVLSKTKIESKKLAVSRTVRYIRKIRSNITD